jgi:hypothetical protein
VGSDDAFPVLDFAEELLVHNIGLRRDRHYAGFGKSLSNHAGAKIVIRVGVRQVNCREVFAGFQDLRDDSMRIGQGPLCVDENGVFLSHYDC